MKYPFNKIFDFMNDSVKHILRHIQKLETVLFRKDYNRWVRLRDSIHPIIDHAKKCKKNGGSDATNVSKD